MLPQISIVRLTDTQKIPLPSYADGVGTCMILRSNEAKSIKIAPQHFEIFSTGFAMALPVGMEAQVRSLKESNKVGLIVLNAPFTIDASDRGEIKVCLFNASQESVIIKQGDPIAMMVFSLALRVQWKDLTQQVVGRIQEKRSQEKNQTSESDKNSEQIYVPTATVEHTDTVDEIKVAPIEEEESDSLSDEEASNLTEEENTPVLSDVPTDEQNIIQTSPDIETEDIAEVENTPVVTEDVKEINDIPTNTENASETNNTLIPEEDQTAEVGVPSILEESQTEAVEVITEPEENQTEQVVSSSVSEEIPPPFAQEEKVEEEETETQSISEENPLIDEPVAPPAILEEFEKIERDFQMEDTENKSE